MEASADARKADARREAARELGSATSDAKSQAARENGKRGGRPKGIAMSAETKLRISETKRRKAALKGDVALESQDDSDGKV